MKKIAIIVIALFSTISVFSQVKHEIYSDTLDVYFKQGSHTVDLQFEGNGERFLEFKKLLKKREAQKDLTLLEIRVEASSSPEGRYYINAALPGQRIAAVFKYLQDQLKLGLDKDLYKKSLFGPNWRGLKLYLNSTNLPFKAQALRILDKKPLLIKRGNKYYEPAKYALMNLQAGVPWSYLLKNVYPSLRFVKIYATYQGPAQEAGKPAVFVAQHLKSDKAPKTITINDNAIRDSLKRVAAIRDSIMNAKRIADSLQQAKMNRIADSLRQIKMQRLADSLKQVALKRKEDSIKALQVTVEPETEVVEVQEKVVPVVQNDSIINPHYYALRTNMVSDLFLIPDLGFEVYLGHNMSAMFNWSYSWWYSDKIKWYWQTYGGDLEFRYWLSPLFNKNIKPLTGLHLGVYAQTRTYDFEFGAKGWQANRKNWNFGAGLALGYSLPVSRRLNIDFSLGLGYFGGNYKLYEPYPKYPDYPQAYKYLETRKLIYFGPTKAEITLVWLFGNGNYNKEGK